MMHSPSPTRADYIPFPFVLPLPGAPPRPPRPPVEVTVPSPAPAPRRPVAASPYTNAYANHGTVMVEIAPGSFCSEVIALRLGLIKAAEKGVEVRTEARKERKIERRQWKARGAARKVKIEAARLSASSV